MDNNEVYALFEDIRNGLKGINDRLENAPKVNNSQSGEQAPAMDLAPIKDLFDSSVKEHQQQTKAMLTKFGEAEVNASNRISGQARSFLFWSAWVSCAASPSGATSSFGSPSGSMRTMP